MDTTERRKRAKDLVAANPDHECAGFFVRAAADLLGQCDNYEQQAHIREKTPELIDLVKQMIDAMNRKPGDGPKPTAEQSVKQGIARQVASALVQGAVELEQNAAMGTSGRMAELLIGAGLPPLLGDTDCDKLRERAKTYRDRAISVLNEAGLTEIGYPMLGGCA